MQMVMRRLDYFGACPNLYIFGAKSYRSLFGSLITLISSIILVAVSFSFGKDFYYKQNPSVLFSDVIADIPTYMNITPTNFNFIFRIEDTNGVLINRSDLFNVTVYHEYIAANPDTLQNEGHEIIYSPSTCKTVIQDTKLITAKNMNEWYCLDYSRDPNFGGSWSYNYINFISIVVSTNCENSGCNFSDVKQFLSHTTPYISFIYPVYYFSPSNYNNPLSVSYYNFYWSLKENIAASNEIYFKKYIVDSDIGWFFESHESIEVAAFDRIEKDFYFQQIRDESDNNEYLYSCNLYWNSNYTQINRVYMKLQDVTALVGGFMQAIFTLGYCLASPYNIFNMNQKLISYILNEEEPNSNDNHNPHQTVESLFKMSSPVSIIKERPLAERDRADPIISDFNGSNIQLPIKQNNFFKSCTGLRRTISHKNLIKPITRDTKISNKFSFTDFMLGNLKCFRNREYLAFRFRQEILERKIDMASFLNFNFQFENLKSIFLNYYQGLSLSYFRKPNVKVIDELEYARSSLYNEIDNFSRKEELIKYFVNSITSSSLLKEDITILDHISPDIRNEIIKNIKSNPV